VPVSSKKCSPPPGGRPIQRAASTRRTVRARTARRLQRRRRNGQSPAENQPARGDLVDLLGCQPLVLTVVPLHEVGVDDRLIAESRQAARLSCAPHRATENELKRFSGEHRRIRSARRRPLSVNGMSVVPVCCPVRLHTVSPCLIASTCMLASAAPDVVPATLQAAQWSLTAARRTMRLAWCDGYRGSGK